MMYDELIYWMRYCSDDKPICEKMYDCPFYDESENNSAYYLCGERMLKKAADAIEDLWQALDTAQGVLAEQPSTWIPVTERLPEDRKMVLATVNGVVCVAFYGNYMWEEAETYSIFYPTHWMPIPQPPEDGE